MKPEIELSERPPIRRTSSSSSGPLGLRFAPIWKLYWNDVEAIYWRLHQAAGPIDAEVTEYSRRYTDMDAELSTKGLPSGVEDVNTARERLVPPKPRVIVSSNDYEDADLETVHDSRLPAIRDFKMTTNNPNLEFGCDDRSCWIYCWSSDLEALATVEWVKNRFAEDDVHLPNLLFHSSSRQYPISIFLLGIVVQVFTGIWWSALPIVLIGGLWMVVLHLGPDYFRRTRSVVIPRTKMEDPTFLESNKAAVMVGALGVLSTIIGVVATWFATR